MLFNSFEFGLFVAAVLGLHLCLPARWRNPLLLVASYVFYANWDWRLAFLLLACTLTAFGGGIMMERAATPARRRGVMLLSLAMHLGVLAFFKYFGFCAGTLAALMNELGLRCGWATLHVILPVGISFYVFQCVSYTVDVYRGDCPAEHRVVNLALYIGFFPQLMAGPIERAPRILPQLRAERRTTLHAVSHGAILVLCGLFQKVVVADNLSQWVDAGIFNGHAVPSGLVALLQVYGFAIQILCDFAGYSNIAKGVASWFGIDLMINFNAPYAATNPREFWQRWHISLSSWLRDYLYIPLGGNRGGTWMTLRNLMLTMLLGGLWHGAAWTFVIWGAFHGLLLCAYRLLPDFRSWSRFLRWGVFFHLVCAGWILFRAHSLAEAARVFSAVFTGPWQGLLRFDPVARRLCMIVCVFVILECIQYKHGDLRAIARFPLWARVPLYLVLIYGVLIFGANDAERFIYLQF